MKSLLAAILLLPFFSYGFNFQYSCKSMKHTGTYDYYVIDLSKRTITFKSLYGNRTTSEVVERNISFKTVPANKHFHKGETLEISNSNGEAIFWIESTNHPRIKLHGSRDYNPRTHTIEAGMACIEGTGVPPVL